MPEVYQHPDPEVGKAQSIRLVDILILGPAMIALGATGKVWPITRAAWVVGGILTVIYNWQNYRRIQEAEVRNAQES